MSLIFDGSLFRTQLCYFSSEQGLMYAGVGLMNEAYQKYVNPTVRTAWLQKWTGDFLRRLDEISDMGREEIKSCCEDYKKKYIEEIKVRSELRAKKRGKELQETSWMNSAANNLSQVRNANGTRLKGDKAVAGRHNFA